MLNENKTEVPKTCGLDSQDTQMMSTGQVRA